MSKLVTVEFRQDTLFAVERDDGVFVAVNPICRSLGLNPDRQRDRIQRDPILSEGATMVVLPSPGGAQETLCLRLELVNGWLFTIDESRVRDEETRQRVLAYKRECYAVLFRHFYGRPYGASTPPPERRPFPDWPLEELRAKKSAVDMYRMNWGLAAAQWIAPQLGWPVPPPELINGQGQFVLALVPFTPEGT